MTSTPKILGRVLLSETQASHLADGASLDLPKAQFREHIKGTARLGDYLWVQEPYLNITSKNVVPSYRKVLMTLCAPFPDQKAIALMLRDSGMRASATMQRRFDGKGLRRDSSRATLEITEVLADATGLRCAVHMKQVDTMPKRGRPQ